MSLLFKRFLALLIDCYTVYIPIFFLLLANANPFYLAFHELFLRALISFIILVVYILFKDLLFRNASLGKKIFGIVVVDSEGAKPTAKQVILRNISVCFLLYVEAVYILANDEHNRLGDKWAKTKVVNAKKASN